MDCCQRLGQARREYRVPVIDANTGRTLMWVQSEGIHKHMKSLLEFGFPGESKKKWKQRRRDKAARKRALRLKARWERQYRDDRYGRIKTP